MTIFGGYGGLDGTTFLNDVWVLSTANGLGGTPAWKKLTPTPDPTYGLPTARLGHTAVYDNTNNRMIIFGGQAGPPSNPVLNDVWVLSHANGLGGTPAWSLVSTLGMTPVPREGHTAVYDSTNNRMTIFGGFGGSYLNDVWVLSDASNVPVEDWILYSTEFK